MLGLWAAESVQASHLPLSLSPAAQTEDAHGGGKSHPNPGSQEDLVSVLVVTHELCNPAQPPCKEGPGTVTVPFPGRKLAAGFNSTNSLFSITDCIFLSVCFCTRMQKDGQRKPAAGGCTFSQFCHFSIPLPASSLLKLSRSIPAFTPWHCPSAKGPPTKKPSGSKKPPEEKWC